MRKKDEDRLNIKSLDELGVNLFKNLKYLKVRLEVCNRKLQYNLKKENTESERDLIYDNLRHIRLIQQEYDLVCEKLSVLKDDRNKHRLLSMYDEDLEDLCISLKVFDNKS